MNTARIRVVRAALLLPVPILVLIALSRPEAGPGPEPTPPRPTAETSLLKPEYAETFAFLAQGRASPGTGRGLFETDFFRPPPPPPPPPPQPKPAPPPPKPVLAAYRGFAAFGANSVAYLAIDGRTVTLAPGAPVAKGWEILSFDADAAELARGEERLRLPFNRPVALPPAPAETSK